MTSSACNPREANKLKERLINDLHVLKAFGAIPLNACWADLAILVAVAYHLINQTHLPAQAIPTNAP